MRIAYFSDNFYPEISGISDSIITLGKNLAAQGHQIAYFAPYYGKKDFHVANLPFKELDLGPNISIYRFKSIPIPGPTNQTRMVIPTGLRGSIKKFQPDILHTQLFTGVGIEALAAAKKLNKPLIGTNHTAISEYVKGDLLKKLTRKFVAWYYNKCEFVTAPSQAVFDEMLEDGFKKPHQVISNPINIQAFSKPESAQFKDEVKQREGFSGLNILYAGRLAPEKNIGTILRALPIVKKQIPGFTLLIAGHGNAAESLKKLCKELKIEENVRFLGTLEIYDLARTYQASDLFVIMSTCETQSITLMQAMATGLPVIGANSRALPEYINEDNGYLVEFNDHETLAKRIIELLQDPELREKLGQGSLNFVQKFSAESIAKQWLEIYSKYI